MFYQTFQNKSPFPRGSAERISHIWRSVEDPTAQKVTFDVPQLLNLKSFLSNTTATCSPTLTCTTAIFHRVKSINRQTNKQQSLCGLGDILLSSDISNFYTTRQHFFKNGFKSYDERFREQRRFFTAAVCCIYIKKRKEFFSCYICAGLCALQGMTKELPFHEKMRRLCVNGVTHCSAKAAE